MRQSLLAFVILFPCALQADDAFQIQVVPFMKEYCVQCHNRKTSEGELDLTRYTSSEMLGEHFRQWEHVVTFLKKEEMPPADAKQPSAKLRADMLKTIEDLLQTEGRKLAGDPGIVLPRRLTNAEYNYTIRDLTGVDIQPANSFPVDPASGEGFNNTGEALTMSPSLFKKYYAAAEHVADHVLVQPSGWQFAPYSVVTYADQKKFYEGAIIRFYEQHNVDFEKYLTAAWTYQHRSGDSRTRTIELWATQHGLSPKYLARLWNTLQADSDDQFYLGWLRQRWNALPAKDTANDIRALASEIRRISRMLCLPETAAIVSNAGNPPIVHTERRKKTAGERDTFNESLLRDSQQIHVELRGLDQRPSVSLFIHVAAPNGGNGFVTLSELNFSTQPSGSYKSNDKKRNTPFEEVLKLHAADQLQRLNFGKHPLGADVAADSLVLASPSFLEIKLPSKAFGKEKRIFFHAKASLDRKHGKQGLVQVTLFDHQPSPVELAKRVANAANPSDIMPLVDPEHPIANKLRKSCREFCALFPNRFLYVDDTRGLSAGFHLIEGFFRDDQPLCKLVLDDKQNQELNRLWGELYFGTGIAEKLLRGFVFFERSERNFMKHRDFDAIKEEDPKLVEDETLSRFRDIYLARSNVKVTGKELESHPIYVFFETIRTGLKKQAANSKRAAPIYLRQLEEFARRAYRRPLTDRELTELRTFFDETRQQPEFGVEQAVRASIVRVLVSPHFCYRMDPLPTGDSVKPLPDNSLASRLSYFLWSSMPDAELLALANAGKLQDVETLTKQTRRMLQDPKVSEFALEFFGQWLGYRDFLQQESVNRQLFPDFDDALKQAMFDEPTRVITHLIQQDLPVTDLLSSDATLVNRRLAKHYGVPFNGPPGKSQADEWARIGGMRQRGRGGLLGMAVFLTKYSQPERTSPVKRGFWVFHKVLGQHIPAPPADVAVLPAKETDTNGMTIRQLLKLHTDNAKCARCHQRFDPIGLSMEGFDPIGRSRAKDLAGRAVDNLVHLPTGSDAHGVPEFSEYLATQRRDEFINTLCRRFLGYALGRSLLVSDQSLLERMQTQLKQNDYCFSALFETVVLSPQFRNQRCRDFSTAQFRAK
ncbi:MAG: DUF1592 domain-containing protein [Planctomycetota bacterium]|nr:DUF1592 domain-containing protein [Planctomycetota bacterium]